jgi:photosystem II stability/assembly factor-like uncharacterized protein
MYETPVFTTKAILAALVLMPLALGCGSPDAGPVEPSQPLPLTPGWTAMPWPSASGGFEDVYFVDENRGWLADVGGSILRTTDGGANWERVYVASGIFPQAVGFATPDIGWLGNVNFSNLPPEAPLYETLDGGESWHDVSARIDGPVAAGLSGIFVLDRDNIFAVGRFMGPAFFMRSNDGGATWKSSDLAPLANGLVDVHFFDRSNGIAVGGVGENPGVFQTVVLRTEDGGASWRQVYRSQTEGTNAWKISFPTPSIGYVSTEGRAYLFSPENRAADGIVLKTEDGGRTWREIAVGAVGPFGNMLWGVGFISADTGWVAAERVIYRTNDGGLSWSESTFGESVNRIRFLPSRMGHAAGWMVYRFIP